MTAITSFEIQKDNQENKDSVEYQDGVIFIKNPCNVSFINKAIKLLGKDKKKAIIDFYLQSKLNYVLVAGTKEKCDIKREEIKKDLLLYAVNDGLYNKFGKEMAEHIALELHGMSSITLLYHTTGYLLNKKYGYYSMNHNELNKYPHDYDDFDRCYNFTKFDIVKNNLDKMKTVHPIWKDIVENWNEYVSLYEQDKNNKTNLFSEKISNLEKELLIKNKIINLDDPNSQKEISEQLETQLNNSH